MAPYPEAKAALGRLANYRLAILSNGSPDMLDALVRNSGLDRYLEAVISVDAKKVYKPDPRAYELVQERLGVRPEEVVFVSSNGFDVAGAKSFGFKVARIERVTSADLQQELASGAPIGPATDVSRPADPDRGAGLHPGRRGGLAARAAGMDFNARYMKVEDRPRPRIGDPRSGVHGLLLDDLVREGADQVGDFDNCLVQGKMPRFENMDLGVGQVLPVSIDFRDGE